ncbi:MAG: hypothetical protein RL062_1038 [Bacteroidota bacterium]
MQKLTTDISVALQALNRDEVIGLPTETVYGLAGNAFKSEVVSKIFAVKNRPFFDPLIVHIGKLEQLSELSESIDPKLEKLMSSFWPGPLTVLLPKTDKIPDLVTSGLPKVAVRMPAHPMALAVLRALDFPLAAPSANPFGYVSPTQAVHVQDQLGDQLNVILDGGDCTVGVESTIVDCRENKVHVLRLGGISIEEIELCLGESVEVELSSSRPAAPGMLDQHYSPMKPLHLIESQKQIPATVGLYGVISFGGNLTGPIRYELSSQGDLIEAASRLFAGLRYMDQQPVQAIYISLLPEQGLGRAMNDRIRRAVIKSKGI